MKNFQQSGHTITIPAPAAVVSGEVVSVGSLIGIAVTAAAEGADLPVLTEGVVTVPKSTGVAIAVGDPVFWHDEAKVANKTPATPIGVAIAVAGSSATEVTIKLNTFFEL